MAPPDRGDIIADLPIDPSVEPAIRGPCQGGLQLVTRSVYVTPQQSSPTSMLVKVSWV